MRDRIDEAIARFGTGRSSFQKALAELRALRAESSDGADDGLLAAFQQAIDTRRLPYRLACSLHQAVYAKADPDGPVGAADRVGAADIETLVARFRPLRRQIPSPPEGTAGYVGQVLCGRFVLDAEIGRGGMGIVYRAVDRRRQQLDGLSPYVAIKLLNPALTGDRAATRMLEAEARRTQTLGHPNIVAVHDFDRDDARVFVVMEHLIGSSLAVTLSRQPDFAGSPPARRALLDLLTGLDYAHRQGIAHADLKPSNLFICDSGRLKILDFGIAKVLAEARTDLAIERAVTPAYASLERLSGHTPSPRDDVYALGCLIHLLLIGKHPFDRRSAQEAMHLGLTPPRLEGLTFRENAMVARTLAFEAARRPADAGAVRHVFMKSAVPRD